MSTTTISQLSQSISLAGTDKFALDSSIGTFNTTLDSMSMYMEQSVSYATTQSILAGDRIKLNRSGTIYTIQPGTSILKDIPTVGTASANQVVIGSDSRLYDSRYPTFHSHSIDDTYLLRDELDKRILNLSIGTANGIASLDYNGKLNQNQIPDNLKGQVLYKGTWNAYSNIPNLSDVGGINKASLVKGNYYVVSNTGTTNFGGSNILEFVVNDWVISNGVKWQKVNNADGIVLLNGKSGRVVNLIASDIPDTVNVSGSNMVGPLMMTGGTNVALASGTGYFFVGPTSSVHIAIDNDSIQSKNNGSISNLYLNELGGNVGIGTTSPTQKLTVQGNIILSEAGPTIGFNDINSLWIGNGNLANTLIFGTSGVERMRIDNTGNVGIGTSTPSAKLVVNGNISTLPSNIGLGGVSTGFYGDTSNLALRPPGSGDIYFQNTGGSVTNFFVKGTTGNVGIGTVTPTSKLQVAGGILAFQGAGATSAHGYGFTNDVDTGMYSSGDGVLTLVSNGIGRIDINGAGNVTLTGAVNAVGSLGVTGTSYINGTMIFNGNSAVCVRRIEGKPNDGYVITGADATLFLQDYNQSNAINFCNSKMIFNGANDSKLYVSGWIETPHIEVTAPGSAYCYIDVGHATSPGTDFAIRIDSNAVIQSNTGYNLQLTSGAGTILANNTIACLGDIIAFYSSDRQLKDNIKNIENPIEKIKKINGVSFDWNDKQNVYTGHDIGIIAQEVEEVLPEIVTTRDNGYKAVKYEKLVALLIEGIKDLQSQIDELKKK